MNEPDKQLPSNNIGYINVQEMLGLYLDKQYNKLSEKFINTFSNLQNIIFLRITPQVQFFINLFMETFLYIFTRADYILSKEEAVTFIRLNPVIANIVAMSAYKNTDIQLKLLTSLPNAKLHLLKILTLYSARNTIGFDCKLFFDTSPQYASLWYFAYFGLRSFPTENMSKNIVRHINNMDDRLMFSPHNIVAPFFSATYNCPDNDKIIKSKINSLVQGYLQSCNIVIKNTPVNNKIAVITRNWVSSHVIYKTFFDYIASLKDDYEITLINLGEDAKKVETGLFQEVKTVKFLNPYELDLGPVINNDFILAFYPDVGMNKESLYLSNLRIAPLQVTGYGHSVSTFGSCIDYYIGGTESELPEYAEKNYSERLVLIPGIGLHPVYPDYSPRLDTSLKKGEKKLIINCPWSSRKQNYLLINTLKQIINSTDKKIIIRIMAGSGLHIQNNFIPYEKDLKNALNYKDIEIVTQSGYKEYMELIEQGDISLDPFPFGGYNTVIDSLYLNKPIITIEGTKAYNRFAAALLRRVGLNEFIVDNVNDYMIKALQIINDDEYRMNLIQKMKSINLKSKIFNTDEPGYFKKAIDYLIANHEKLKAQNSKAVIIIDENE